MVEHSDTSELRRSDDGGFTLVEVMVAMMVFAIIFLGVAYSTATASRMTADARSRTVAAQLAAQEIDAVRAIADPFKVDGNVDAPSEVSVGGVTYTIIRKASWTTTTGATSSCGVGTGNLLYKNVNVTVSWPGQLAANSSARADTILAPKSRLNDPSYGSILVSVVNARGLGAEGITITVAPDGSGAQPLTVKPANTDGDGCSYAFMVAPGAYKVEVSRGGYLSDAQQATPSANVSVAAGTTASRSFQFDKAGTFAVSYASDAVDLGLTAVLPSSVPTVYLNSSGVFPRSGKPQLVSLFPFTSGYDVVAGEYATADGVVRCAAYDPAQWPEGTSGAVAVAAGARATATAEPGGTAALSIPMGLVTVTPTAAEMRFVQSAVVTPGSGDPGCASPATYMYSGLAMNQTVTLAVPYGSWTLQEKIGSTWVTVPAARQAFPTNVAGPLVNGDVVTLDPRKAAS